MGRGKAIISFQKRGVGGEKIASQKEVDAGVVGGKFCVQSDER